jgi:hypothetical protein
VYNVIRAIIIGALLLYGAYMVYPYVMRIWPDRPKDKTDKREVW